MNPIIDIHPDVQKAIDQGMGVVALESTIISHGMPYPQNFEMAERVETIIKDNGAQPATIAMIDGKIKIGLTKQELSYLSQNKDVMKVSKRDIPYVMTKQLNGATTVSATMIFAQMAGIKVFATGGIGGVHRHAEETFDISRDLEELSMVDITVVCAGAKSILDLPKTLEYLETKGVSVLGYQTDELPAFYTRESGLNVDYRVDDALSVAKLMHAKDLAQLSGGIVVANPIPKKDSLDKQYINAIIDESLKEAKDKGVSGKDTTPYLLAAIKDKTQGKSLKANLALVYNNASVAALIASAYASIKQQSQGKD